MSVNGVLFDKSESTLLQYPMAVAGSYTIPGGVTSIGEWAFSDCFSLTNVSIPSTVTSIGKGAFSYCASLASITIPGSVTNIGDEAFEECACLTAITVDTNNLFYIGVNGVLFDRNQATLIQYPPNSVGGSYTIPSGVTSIGDAAFVGTSLTNVSIPSTVTSIGNGAFSYCASLTSMTIPNSVTSIGANTFGNCSQLASISIPNSITNIGESAFWECTNLTSVTIPNSVTSIGGVAFYDSSLTSVTIPGSITSIGEEAFSDDTRLNNVYFAGDAPTVGFSPFYGENLTVYYLPGTTGWGAFSSSTGLTAVLWSPVIQTGSGSFGVQNNRFGFTITNGATTNIPIVVEACTNLACPVWTPVTNVMLTNSFYFSDPQWTNYPARYYGLGFP